MASGLYFIWQALERRKWERLRRRVGLDRAKLARAIGRYLRDITEATGEGVGELEMPLIEHACAVLGIDAYTDYRNDRLAFDPPIEGWLVANGYPEMIDWLPPRRGDE